MKIIIIMVIMVVGIDILVVGTAVVMIDGSGSSGSSG